MTDGLDSVFDRLQTSKFRRTFHLREKERAYLQDKGMEIVLSHAQDFVRSRLADANPKNDGRQTPWGNHPVFVAQHATATCCRGCLEKWHGIPKGKPLSDAEQAYIVSVIERWLQDAK
ncbi:MAG: DUF4186 domain-containing protein [Cyanobacteria bacterium J06638_20]